MATASAPRGRQLVLHGEPWETYVRMLRLFDGRRRLRITYDRGTLEIMTLSPEHESWKYLLGRLVDAATEELGLPIAGYGSMTCKRRKKKKGLEPDNCYWIANADKIRGKNKINFRTDPPPDLCLEIDITHSSLDRMDIYAALGVPEVWRLDEQGLTFQALQPGGSYAEVASSLSFPLVSAADVNRFLALRGQEDDNAIVRQFREWLRQQIANARAPGA
jgi:Uma2 family endonuclease